MNSKQLGNFGENIACYYLKNKGYKILDRNYIKKFSSASKGEIDIVAKKDGVISFIEIKTSKNPAGVAGGVFLSEDRVNYQKQKQLIKLAQIWLNERKISLESKWQIDIIAITADLNSKKAKIRHLKNAVC